MERFAKMEIKSDLKSNYFKIYSEARGVALNKRRVLQKKNAKCLSYFTIILWLWIALGVLSVAVGFGVYKWLVYVFIVIDFLAILSPIIRTIGNYKWKKANNFLNTVIIDEKGITDKSYKGITITIPWNKIKGVVVKKYSLTILSDVAIYFYFSSESQDVVLKECLKYIDKCKIIKG